MCVCMQFLPTMISSNVECYCIKYGMWGYTTSGYITKKNAELMDYNWWAMSLVHWGWGYPQWDMTRFNQFDNIWYNQRQSLGYPLVNIQKTMERSTMFNRKIHYFNGLFNSKLSNYQAGYIPWQYPIESQSLVPLNNYFYPIEHH